MTIDLTTESITDETGPLETDLTELKSISKILPSPNEPSMELSE